MIVRSDPKDLTLDCEYITQEEFQDAYSMAGECRKQIKGFRKYLRTCNPMSPNS